MEEILNFLIEEIKQPKVLATRNTKRLCKYEDIKNEFLKWTKTKQYPENGIVIDGYSAKKISEMATFMNGVGVYDFMVSLRDNPDFAKEMIEKKFPRK